MRDELFDQLALFGAGARGRSHSFDTKNSMRRAGRREGQGPGLPATPSPARKKPGEGAISREFPVPRRGRPIVLVADPESGTITIREKGCRDVYGIRVLELFQLLIRLDKKVGK